MFVCLFVGLFCFGSFIIIIMSHSLTRLTHHHATEIFEINKCWKYCRRLRTCTYMQTLQTTSRASNPSDDKISRTVLQHNLVTPKVPTTVRDMHVHRQQTPGTNDYPVTILVVVIVTGNLFFLRCRTVDPLAAPNGSNCLHSSSVSVFPSLFFLLSVALSLV